MHQTIRNSVHEKSVFALHILALVSALAGAPVFAADLQPGLWEMRTDQNGFFDLDKFNDQMRRQIDAMPIEQRKQMDALMIRPAEQVTGAGGAVIRQQFCMLKGATEPEKLPAQLPPSCTQTLLSQTADSTKSKLVCTQPPMSGESEFVMISDRAYVLKSAFNMTINGTPRNFAMTLSASWLGDDCGSVKSMAP